MKLSAKTLASVNYYHSQSYCQVYLSLKRMTQLLWAPLLKRYARNRSLLTTEVGNIVRLLLLSQATDAKTDDIFSALKHVKTYLRSAIGNNQLHALILEYVCKDILDNKFSWCCEWICWWKRQPHTNIQTFFSELFMIYVRLS